jgi:hypothetical protein
MTEEQIPLHEKLKKELMGKFTPSNTYLGSFIKSTIQQMDFKDLKGMRPPNKIKKGDVFVAFFKKPRPCVVVKVLNDRTCLYMPLTSTENVHCNTTFKSRFFGEGCFSKTISVCTEDFALKNFVGVFDNMRDLNRAIINLKEFINTNL